MSGSLDWLEILKSMGSLAGSASGAGGAGLGLPDASAATGATTSGMGLGGTGLPGGGVVEPASNMVVPQFNTDAMMPGPSTFQPPLPVPPVPPTAARPGGPSLPVPPAATPPPSTTPSAVANLPQLDTDLVMPGDKTEGFGRSWFRRNIGDPWDKAWTEDPKTGLSKGQKVLEGLGSMAGKLGGGGGSAAPVISGGGGGGGSAYHPTGKIDAAQMALAREQARQLLIQRATLNAPWLKRPLTGGLMG